MSEYKLREVYTMRLPYYAKAEGRITGRDTATIATLEPWAVGQGHQEFIVRACNAHEGLVRALEAITELYNTDEGCRTTSEYINARAALAAAKGEM